jgi:hypothetical protein
MLKTATLFTPNCRRAQYVVALTVASAKQEEDPITLLWSRPQQTLISTELQTCRVVSPGLSVPHMHQLCLFTILLIWKEALSVKRTA